jgi:hypothetical protein
VDFRVSVDLEVDAWRIRARTRLAMPRVLMAPMTFVLIVLMALYW